MNSPRTRTRTPLAKLIGEVDPQEKARISQCMALAVKIANALSTKGLNKVQFAQSMGKAPSEITKWLSGTHNFTVDTLTDIGHALDIDFFQTERKEVAQVSFVSVIVPAQGHPSNRGRYFGNLHDMNSEPVIHMMVS